MRHTSFDIIQQEHASLSAMLHSLRLMLERGPGKNAAQYFEVMRAMLFYIDEYPEKLHHPKESELLFPGVARAAPELAAVIERLERDHEHSEKGVRELQHLLTAWEMLGDSRQQAFLQRCRSYIDAYLDHMHVEETEILPRALDALSNEEWLRMDNAFDANRDPMTRIHPPDPSFERLYTLIVSKAPAPIGVGES